MNPAIYAATDAATLARRSVAEGRPLDPAETARLATLMGELLDGRVVAFDALEAAEFERVLGRLAHRSEPAPAVPVPVPVTWVMEGTRTRFRFRVSGGASAGDAT